MMQSDPLTVEARRLDTRTLIAIMVVVAFAVVALDHVWTRFPTDLSALFMAAHFFALEEYALIYDAPVGFFGNSPPLWAPYLPALGLEGQPVPYVYPPIWAALAAPVTELVGPEPFFRTFAVVKIMALSASIFLAWRLCRSFAMPLWAWTLTAVALLATSTITLTALFYLQPQILVVFLILLAFERYAHGHLRTAGGLLALAAMMKVAPAGLAIIFLLDRNWRALGAFAGVLLALVGLSLALAGVDLHFAFLAAMGKASQGILVTSINYSVELLLFGAFSEIDMTARNVIVVPSAFVILSAKAIGLVLLGWAILATAKIPAEQRLPARLILLGLLLNLFGPLGWAHYYLTQIFLLPALIGLLPRHIGVPVIAVFAALTSWPLLMVLRLWLPGDFPIAALATCTMLLLFITVLIVLIRKHQRV